MRRQTWLNDFRLVRSGVVIQKTGVALALNWPLVKEVAQWTMYLFVLLIAGISARLRRKRSPSLWFYPDLPRPWYLIWGAAVWAGMTLASSQETATASVYFDDSTLGLLPVPLSRTAINGRCTNIEKSYVALVFAEIFGYPLTIDPRTAQGEIVEKPEKNGVHGGRIVVAPWEPRPGYAYQRVVDTRDEHGRCRDLRTLCVGGKPILVWVKVKPVAGRFSINNRRAFLAEVHDLFSSEELEKINLFNTRMGLDWGGLDILRDVSNGRIYIVDVNKTDLGPVIALPWRDKLLSMRRLSAALDALVLRLAEK